MVNRQHTWVGLVLLMILLLATALRFWRLGELPPGLYHDEAYNGLDALSLVQGKTFPQFYEGWELYAQDAHANRPSVPTRFPMFFEGNYGREPLHVYLMALSMSVFGVTPLAVRAVPAAAGMLAVLTTFLAAWSLFPEGNQPGVSRWLVPLAAAFTLAVLYPAVQFSRFGIRAMLFLPCATVAVFAFWRAYRGVGGRAYVWYAISGLFLGLGLYTYAAARLLPLLFVGFGLFLLVVDRAALRKSLGGFAVMALAAFVTSLPILLFFYNYPYYFAFRLAYVANRGAGTVPGAPLQTWLLNVGRVIGGLFWQGEMHVRHNLPGRPYLDLIQRVLLLVGLGWSLWRWRKAELTFVVLWLGIMLLPSVMSGDAPHFGRLSGAAPPIAIVVALGAEVVVGWVAARPRSPKWVTPLLVVALFLPSLFWTTRDYFVSFANHPDLARDFYVAEWNMGQFAAQQAADTAIYLSPTQEEMATIYFAMQGTERLQSYSEGETLTPVGYTDRPILYLIRPGQDATLNNLRSLFPTTTPGAEQDGYIPFEVGREAVRNWPQSESPVAVGPTIALAGYALEQQPESLVATLVWRALQAEPRDLTVFVHVEDANGQVVAQTDRPPSGYPTTEWRPGEEIVDRLAVDLPADLAPGDYTVTAGLYYLPTLERVGQAVPIGTVTID